MANRSLQLWLPFGVWVLAIFGVSSLRDLGTAPVGAPGLDKLFHTGEYAVLGFLFARATSRRWSGWRAIGSTLLLGLVLGSLDELYQSTVPGRAVDVFDVCADVIGATCGALLWNWTRARRGSRLT
ncbi:MAG: VanZ family protein [Candidatus Latescibacterota bacterium]|nr:MAG: VanZ family protein [Candidatus Latescibacterota bacterium]